MSQNSANMESSTSANAFDLRATGHARVISAQNSYKTVVVEVTGSASPIKANAQQSTLTYHNTGVQVLPPANGTVFLEIHGRDPTDSDEVGLAGYGRYHAEPGANPHDLVYGAAFQVEKKSSKPNYVDSGFQTVDFPIRKIALAKAKAKASMTVNKFKKVAEDCGYRIWVDRNDEQVIHSEQYPFTIKLNDDGNVQGEEDITGRFLPNIYKDEIVSKIACGESKKMTDQKPTPKQDVATPASSQKLLHLTSSLLSVENNDIELRPIPAINPSTPTGSLPEDTPERSQAYGESIDSFVVFDPALSTPIPTGPRHYHSSSSPLKRKSSSPPESAKDDSKSKRSRVEKLPVSEEKKAREEAKEKVRAGSMPRTPRGPRAEMPGYLPRALRQRDLSNPNRA
ncbi:hypothetical protein GQ44DRAFT_774532 [Phaeosphaeriaceae sp. PMI808]|nr:hypothetical protein GQ44DRAFT_774532 [Phaeosphaeriaceae sp. PMI808]